MVGDDARTPEDLEVWAVPVRDLLSHCNPFAAWSVAPLTRLEVRAAVREGLFDERPFDTIRHDAARTENDEREYHRRRIAWLVANPDGTPIEIDIGAPSLGWHPMTGAFDFIDGNHRLCAAAIRGDHAIAVTYGGECDAFPVLFPRATLMQRGREDVEEMIANV